MASQLGDGDNNPIVRSPPKVDFSLSASAGSDVVPCNDLVAIDTENHGMVYVLVDDAPHSRLCLFSLKMWLPCVGLCGIGRSHTHGRLAAVPRPLRSRHPVLPYLSSAQALRR